MNAAESRKAFVNNLKYLDEVFARFNDRKYVIGIDQSLSNTAVSVYNLDKVPKKDRIKVYSVSDYIKESTRKNRTVYQRLHLMRERLLQLIKSHPSCFVVVEGYAYSTKQNRELAGEVGGTVRWILWDNSKFAGPSLLVSPLSLKKYILGAYRKSGPLTKERIIMMVYKKYGIEVKNNDEADAIVLSKIGRDFVKFVKKYAEEVQKMTDVDARKFMLNGWNNKDCKLKKYQWEVVVSLMVKRGDVKIMDFYDDESHS